MDAGKKAYEKILDNNAQLEYARVALSYLGMRIRQNNTKGSVQFISGGIDGSDVLKLVHSGDFEGMVTYIYFSDGELRELFTWAEGEPDPNFSETIVSLKGLDMKKGDGYIKFTAHYSEDGYPKRLEQIVGLIGY